MIDNCIAESTRRIINKRGLKHQAVARQIGMTERQFSDMLNRRRIVRDTDIAALANALGVTPNELFGIEAQDN